MTSVRQQPPLRTTKDKYETRRAQLRVRWAGGLEHSSVIRSRNVWHWKFQTPPQNCSFQRCYCGSISF